MNQKPEDAGFLAQPLVQLALATLTLTAGLRLVFFVFSKRIWALAENVPLNQISDWTRWAMANRDGAEPQVLLLITLALAVLTFPVIELLKRDRGWLREVVLVCCLVGVALVPPRTPAPMADIDRVWWHVLVAEAAIFLAAFVACWAVRRRAFYFLPAVLLLPVCFLPVALPRYDDLSCVLAPALRLRLGFSPANVYFQYDYLMSLLAVAWHRLGGDPYAFPWCTHLAYYLLLAGCFLLARRLFEQPRLAGLLLVALCVVRVYALLGDANAVPQVTPLRLDLWILLLAPALLFGLRHWSVGLAAGLVCFFGRSFGILYLGSYALALSADFIAARTAAQEAPRLPLWRDISAGIRQTAPALILIGAGLLAARLVFGAVVSDAMATYRRLGLGMMRISPNSFYWWVAPMLAAAGWLAFSVRGRIPEKRAAASLFAVALAIGNSIYFFGRSHENNLLNISASLLLCLFLGIDLALVTWRTGPGWVRWTLHAAPWLILALIAFSYSGRLVEKVRIQAAVATRRQPLYSTDDPGPIDCAEIAAVARDSRVFVYGAYDYWFYERCGYVPQGYIQPLLLQPMRAKVVQQANQLLDAGYKIVAPKLPYIYISGGFEFDDIEASLGRLESVETAHYHIYCRKP